MPSMKSLLFKTLGMILALPLALAVSTASIFAAVDAYPTKTVRLICATTPGGSNDTNARLIATELSERLGKQMIVDNRGGGGGIIGTEIAAKADPDGYTLLLIVTTNAIQPALHKLPYDTMKAFIPIARVSLGTGVLVVHSSVPAKSVKELIALAKKKPGELIFSSAGAGSTVHLNIELFKMMADIEFRIEQFKSAGPAVIELVGGHSHSSIGSIASMLPHIKSGRIRALGTTGTERHFALPDVPTIAEAGIPGFSSSSWYGIVAPTGTPAPILDRLDKEIKTIMASDEVKKRFRDRGVEPGYLGRAEFGAFLEAEIAKWGQVVKKANIKSLE